MPLSEAQEFLEYLLKSDKNLKYMSQGALLGLVLFILYLEVSPKLGNIWFRYSSEGVRTIQPDSLAHFLSYPFKNKLFWKPENWDLNFLAVSGMVGGAYTLIRQGINFKR